MSSIYFILLLVIFWQPIYIGGKIIYYKFSGTIYDTEAHNKALSGWFGQLWSLVFSKPGV